MGHAPNPPTHPRLAAHYHAGYRAGLKQHHSEGVNEALSGLSDLAKQVGGEYDYDAENMEAEVTFKDYDSAASFAQKAQDLYPNAYVDITGDDGESDTDGDGCGPDDEDNDGDYVDSSYTVTVAFYDEGDEASDPDSVGGTGNTSDAYDNDVRTNVKEAVSAAAAARKRARSMRKKLAKSPAYHLYGKPKR